MRTLPIGDEYFIWRIRRHRYPGRSGGYPAVSAQGSAGIVDSPELEHLPQFSPSTSIKQEDFGLNEHFPNYLKEVISKLPDFLPEMPRWLWGNGISTD